MSGPRLDDPHFTPARYGLEVTLSWEAGHRDHETRVRVTSIGHSGHVTQHAPLHERLETLTWAVSAALREFERDPKWEPAASPRY